MAAPPLGGMGQDPLTSLLLTPIPATPAIQTVVARTVTVQPVVQPTIQATIIQPAQFTPAVDRPTSPGTVIGLPVRPVSPRSPGAILTTTVAPMTIRGDLALYPTDDIVMFDTPPNGCLHDAQGRRETMEDDEFVAQLGPNVWFYGVLDGHGGSKASKEFSVTIPRAVSRHFQGIDLNDATAVRQAVQRAFLEEDQKWYRDNRTMMDGTTLTAAIVTSNYIDTVNLGDSRTLIYYRNRVGGRITATVDHKPNDAEEKARVEAVGGHVTFNRVQGALAVSRALGDNDFKYDPNVHIRNERPYIGERAMVSPIPDVERHNRPIMGGVIVLACDGLWDVYSNDEVFEFIKAHDVPDAQRSKALVKIALDRRSLDNVTVMIVDLN